MTQPTLHLAIDIGNSRTKWGWYAPAAPRAVPVWAGLHSCTHERFDAEVADTLPVGAIPGVATLCCVASAAVYDHCVDTLSRTWAALRVERFASSAAVGGIRNGYADPASLGHDRLAAVLGARLHVAQGAIVVVAFGTATTVNVLSVDDVFMGGVILPGAGLMLRTLVRNTAQLPEVSIERGFDVPWPVATPDAIAEGVIRAQIGAVSETLARARERLGQVALVATGGAAPILAPRLPQPCRVIDHLVLDGLAAAQSCRPSR